MAKRKREVRRQPIGMSVAHCMGRASACAHLIYRVDWSDGTTTTERGATVWGHGVISGNEECCRPDLDASLRALDILYECVENVCLHVDESLKKGKKKKG